MADNEGETRRGDRWRDFEPGLRGEVQPLDSGVGGGTTKLDDLQIGDVLKASTVKLRQLQKRWLVVVTWSVAVMGQCRVRVG